MKKDNFFPSDKEIKKMNRKVSKVQGTYLLPPDASQLDRLKYSLCKKLVIYLRENGLTQAELAKRLKITTSRMSEVLNYRFKRISLDFLVELLEKIHIETRLVANK